MSMSVSCAIAPISISSTPIRVLDGLFSLNDLHKASGGEKRHQPSDWLRVQQTQDLIAELAKDYDPGKPVSSAQDEPGIPGTSQDDENTVEFPVIPLAIKTVRGRGKAQGTYACKELVYSYGMWISPRFNLQVIRAFDAMRQAPTALPSLLTTAQAGELATLLAERFPEGKDRAYAWSRFNNHFRIARYRELPASRFDEARGYIQTIPLRALPPPAMGEPITPDLLGAIEMAAVRIQRCFPRVSPVRGRVMRRLAAEVGVEKLADVTLDHLPKLFGCLSRMERHAEHYQMLADNAEKSAVMHLLWRLPEDETAPTPSWVAMIA